MKLEFKNGNVVSFEGNVDEYLEVKDVLSPEFIDIDVLQFYGDTIEEQIDNYIKAHKYGLSLKLKED